MYSLGRRDLLEPRVTLIELAIMEDSLRKPLSMPDVGESNVIVSGETSVGDAERLIVCNSLEEMVNQYAASIRLLHSSVTEFRWYFADKQECELAHSNRAIGVV